MSTETHLTQPLNEGWTTEFIVCLSLHTLVAE